MPTRILVTEFEIAELCMSEDISVVGHVEAFELEGEGKFVVTVTFVEGESEEYVAEDLDTAIDMAMYPSPGRIRTQLVHLGNISPDGPMN